MDIFSQYGDAFGAVLANGFNRLIPIAEYLAVCMTTLAVMLTCMGAMFRSHGLMGMAFKLAVTADFTFSSSRTSRRSARGSWRAPSATA
jgi:hypothetical protein